MGDSTFTEEKLISLVQEYKHLYDLFDPLYHSAHARENSWEEIGTILKTPGTVCKDRWRSLRESYRKAMNFRRTKSGKSAKKIRPWRLEAQMEFVKPYVLPQNDEQLSNVSPLPESPTSGASSSSDVDKNEDELEDQKFDPTIYSTSGGGNMPSSSVSAKKIGKKRKTKSSRTSAEILRDYINMKLSSNSNPPSVPSGDHLTKYFQSIEETVRTLPPHVQIRLKTQISNLVHEAELENIDG